MAERLDAVLTREPGGTELGAELRGLLLAAQSYVLGPRAEALLMAADRAQHLSELVVPTLSAGRHVVSDRTAYSSLAYQGAGRGLGVDQIKAINDWAVYGRWPDAVVYLRVPRDVAVDRLRRSLDRFEREDESFHIRIGEAFDEMAAAEPERWIVVDGTMPVDEVTTQVAKELADRMPALGIG